MRTPWLMAATAVFLVSASLGPSASVAESDPGQTLLVEQGERLFRQYCASCHGVAALGDGPAAAALRTPPADLTRIAERRDGEFPEGDIAAFIDGRFAVDAHGTREMPIWGRRLAVPIAEGIAGDEVARGQIQSLIEYLKTLQQPLAEAP